MNTSVNLPLLHSHSKAGGMIPPKLLIEVVKTRTVFGDISQGKPMTPGHFNELFKDEFVLELKLNDQDSQNLTAFIRAL